MRLPILWTLGFTSAAANRTQPESKDNIRPSFWETGQISIKNKNDFQIDYIVNESYFCLICFNMRSGTEKSSPRGQAAH
jgi:hypothetical protein